MASKPVGVLPQPSSDQVRRRSRSPVVVPFVMAAEGVAFAALLGLDRSPPWQVAQVLVTLVLTALAVWFTRRAGRTGQAATALVLGIAGTAAGGGVAGAHLAKAAVDATGLLATVVLVTGVFLLIWGAAALVRTIPGWWRLLGGLLAAALGAGLLPALTACGGATTARGRVPVIVDTDMGSDDIMALAYLLKQPSISVQAVTIEGTGVAHGLAGARNVLRLIQALGIHRTIPVGYGPPTPLAGVHSFPSGWRATADGMYDLGLPAWTGRQPARSAVGLLTGTINSSARPVTVITLGPFTNLALAMQADPGIARRIGMVYSMAGALRVEGNEPSHRRAEWNVYIDAMAANQVLRSEAPMTFIPLDASDNVPITPFFRDAVATRPQTPALRLIATMLRDPYYVRAPAYFWDPLAAVAATSHGAVRLHAARLRIGTGQGPDLGVTRISPAGAPVHVALTADAAAFQRQFLATLNDGRPVPVPAVPASRRITVTFDGSTYRYHGPRTAASGRFEVQLADRSTVPFDSFALVVGKLAAGRSLADVRAVIRRGTAASVPAWFTITASLPASPATQPAWGLSLGPGKYALVCVRARDGALYAPTEITIR